MADDKKLVSEITPMDVDFAQWYTCLLYTSIDLVSNGVRGIHLYTMNNPFVARRITENVGSIIRSLNK